VHNILLLFDVPNWANDAAAKALEMHLHRCAPGAFNIVRERNGARTAAQFEWADLLFSHAFYDWRHAHHPRSVTQVSGGNYLIRRATPEKYPDAVPNLQRWQHIVAKNQALMDLLGTDDHPRITKLYHPFDHELFTPQGPAMKRDDVFRVGFAGHTSSASKGVRFMREACDRIDGAELVVTTYERGPAGQIPYALMPSWYRSLDCYVCMAEKDVTEGGTLGGQEGGPRPPVEAMLCGVPLIVSPGGQIGEMVEDEANALVIERNTDALEVAIRRLMDEEWLRTRLAVDGRESIMQRWILDVGQEWTDYFVGILEGGR